MRVFCNRFDFSATVSLKSSCLLGLHFAWVVVDANCIVVTRICVSVCLSAAACPHYCTDPDVTWQSGRGCPLAVHCWADLQSVGLRCCGNVTRTRNVSEYMLVLVVCLVSIFVLKTPLQVAVRVVTCAQMHANMRFLKAYTCSVNERNGVDFYDTWSRIWCKWSHSLPWFWKRCSGFIKSFT